MKLKLMKLGNSVGMVLPKQARTKMKVDSGDVLYLTETPEGYTLTPYDPEFAKQMDTARRIMARRRAALHELAK